MTRPLARGSSGGAADRSALLLACDVYQDLAWPQLGAAASDAEALAEVLGDPAIGGFDVEVMTNRPAQEQRLKLAEFFAQREEDDLLLVHFGCHGALDRAGNLHFAASDTSTEHVAATGVPAALLRDLMQNSGSRRIVLMLDCCFSAAFVPRGTASSHTLAEELEEIFTGHGHAILSATNEHQQAWEVPEIGGALFTQTLIEGLRTGDADRDGDGWISLEDLHSYLSERLSKRAIQTATLSLQRLEGTLLIAAAVRSQELGLPARVSLALVSPLMPVRRDAIVELASLLDGDDDLAARAARLALHRLTKDDSKTVSSAAARVLDPTIQRSNRRASRRATATEELQGLHYEKIAPEIDLGEVPVDALVAAIDTCERAIGRDETRPGLINFNLRFAATEVVVMTTDSYRLSEARIEIPGTPAQAAIAVPARAAHELRDALVASSSRVVHIGQVGGQTAFSFADVHTWCYARDHLSINYRSLFPPAEIAPLKVARSSLLEAAVRAEKQSPTYGPVRLIVEDGTLRVRTQRQKRGIAVAVLESQGVPDIIVGLNPSFLLDAVTSLRGDQTDVLISAPNSAIALTHGPSKTAHLIMPVRLAS